VGRYQKRGRKRHLIGKTQKSSQKPKKTGVKRHTTGERRVESGLVKGFLRQRKSTVGATLENRREKRSQKSEIKVAEASALARGDSFGLLKEPLESVDLLLVQGGKPPKRSDNIKDKARGKSDR